MKQHTNNNIQKCFKRHFLVCAECRLRIICFICILHLDSSAEFCQLVKKVYLVSTEMVLLTLDNTKPLSLTRFVNLYRDNILYHWTNVHIWSLFVIFYQQFNYLESFGKLWDFWQFSNILLHWVLFLDLFMDLYFGLHPASGSV